MDPSVLPSPRQPRSFIGTADGRTVKAEDLGSHLASYGVPQKGNAESRSFPFPYPAIARIDGWSKGRTDDLPLVVTVGINPGDGREQNRAMAAMGIYAHTNLRPRLDQAFDLARSTIPSANGYSLFPRQDEYHLVMVYLFPWLTEKAWENMKLSPLDEGLLVYGMGYNDPLLALKALLKHLTEENLPVDWIVFHGASPLIPATASLYAQQRKLTDPDVLICDELGGTTPISNSVALGRPIIQRHNTVDTNVDE